ncbi:MAG TPA: hypothetical protein VFM99_07650 [Chitinophagales bacterium]|nr:hypothetical protein [Chitinophagales bacterium]
MNNSIAVHESETSEKVVKFIELEHFTQGFQDMYNNNTVDGVYFNDKGKIVCRDTSGDIEENIRFTMANTRGRLKYKNLIAKT